MKYMRFAFRHLRWRTLLFVVTTVVLLFYQILFSYLALATWERMFVFPITSHLTRFLFYLLRALVMAAIVSLSFSLYSCHLTYRLDRIITAVKHWSQGNFAATVQDDTRDTIGQLAHHLNSMAQQLQKTMEIQQELASSNERNHLARELHDTVKQQVFALTFQITIARKLHQGRNDQLTRHLQEAQKILDDIQVEMTNLIFPMHQAIRENQDLNEALATYLFKWSYQYGIFVKFTTEIQGQEKNYFLSAHVKGTFFRVAQEALSNVARHSKASSVHVTLTISWLRVTLKIVDDGQGFNSTAQQEKPGMGLSSMLERMQAIDGELKVSSKKHSGTEVIAMYDMKDTEPFDVTELPTPRLNTEAQTATWLHRFLNERI